MARILRRTSRYPLCRRDTVLLALFWVLGLCAGQAVCILSEPLSTSVMRSAASSAVSIVGLLHTLFPFFLSAIAIALHAPRMLLALSFGKAFLSSYASLAICRFFGTSGWLARWFLMFSDLFTLPMLYFLWHRCLAADRTVSIPEALLLMSFALLIASIDYSIISMLFLAFVNS